MAKRIAAACDKIDDRSRIYFSRSELSSQSVFGRYPHLGWLESDQVTEAGVFDGTFAHIWIAY